MPEPLRDFKRLFPVKQNDGTIAILAEFDPSNLEMPFPNVPATSYVLVRIVDPRKRVNIDDANSGRGYDCMTSE